MRIFFLIFISLFSVKILAQNTLNPDLDTLTLDNLGIESFTTVSKVDPKKAAMLAAVFPGLGKIYNKQHWKLPIVYGGFILFGHYLKFNNDFFHSFRNAYIAETDNDPNTINPYPQFGESSLQRNAEQFRRNRDLVMISMAIFYLVNIVETHVSAHLREFEVNDDLAFKIQPSAYAASRYTVQNIGLSIVIPLNK